MEEIARAVQAAAYNDAVVVEVEGREFVLVPTIDQSVGGVVWQDVAAAAATQGVASVTVSVTASVTNLKLADGPARKSIRPSLRRRRRRRARAR